MNIIVALTSPGQQLSISFFANLLRTIGITGSIFSLLILKKYKAIIHQTPQRDSGSVRTKKILHALEDETKVNFQENIPGKVRFQKKVIRHSSFVGGPVHSQTSFGSFKFSILCSSRLF